MQGPLLVYVFLLQDPLERDTPCAEDDLVRHNLGAILCGQGDISVINPSLARSLSGFEGFFLKSQSKKA